MVRSLLGELESWLNLLLSPLRLFSNAKPMVLFLDDVSIHEGETLTITRQLPLSTSCRIVTLVTAATPFLHQHILPVPGTV
jgi:hypothetical protein